MFLGDSVWRITCQRLTNDRIVRCIIAYQFCIDDCVSVIFVLCFDNFVLCFGNFMSCLDNIVLCLDNIVFCFDNFVLCLDNIVLCLDNFVLCLDNIVLCFDNFVLCFKNIVLCFKNCLLCLQIWATVVLTSFFYGVKKKLQYMLWCEIRKKFLMAIFQNTKIFFHFHVYYREAWNENVN